MRLLLTMWLAATLAACGDDGQVSPDAPITVDAAAVIDAPPTPAIDWSAWGQPCARPIYGPQSCTASDGQTPGTCILTGDPGSNGVYPGTCKPYCFTNPPYVHECPPDGKAVYDGEHSQPCHCEQL